MMKKIFFLLLSLLHNIRYLRYFNNTALLPSSINQVYVSLHTPIYYVGKKLHRTIFLLKTQGALACC